MLKFRTLLAGLALTSAFVASSGLARSLDDRVDAAFAAPDRPAGQKARDADRRDEVKFVVSQVHTGDNVLDFGAGGGFSTMILSSVVGPQGHVDSQNPTQWVEKSEKLRAAQAFLAKTRPNIGLVTAKFDEIPLPAKPYDEVVSVMIYHDTFNDLGTDTLKMNKALFAALKPGGTYIIIDHNDLAGAGTKTTNTTHRIEKSALVEQVKAAGFVVVEDFKGLENPADDHTKNVFDPSLRGHTDRFAIVFKKP